MNHEQIQKHCLIGGSVLLAFTLILEFKNAHGAGYAQTDRNIRLSAPQQSESLKF